MLMKRTSPRLWPHCRYCLTSLHVLALFGRFSVLIHAGALWDMCCCAAQAWVQHHPKFFGLKVDHDAYSDGSLMDDVMQVLCLSLPHLNKPCPALRSVVSQPVGHAGGTPDPPPTSSSTPPPSPCALCLGSS